MYTELEKLHKKVFEDHCIRLKANPVMMQSIKRAQDVIEIGDDPIDGYVGRDWQGNTLTVIDESTPIIEALLNNQPLHYGDDEDYEYSLEHLEHYTVTVDQAIELFNSTETLVICGRDSMNDLYDTTRKYLFQLRDYNIMDVHSQTDLDEDYAKMEELLEWLKPIVKYQGGDFRTDSPLARLFSAGFRKLGAIDVDSDDILITKRKEVYGDSSAMHGVVTMDNILGG